MRWFTAPDDAELIETVTVGGRDVTDVCARFWGSDLPGLTLPGEAELVDSPPRQENGELVTHWVSGDVVWQQKVVGGLPNDLS